MLRIVIRFAPVLTIMALLTVSMALWIGSYYPTDVLAAAVLEGDTYKLLRVDINRPFSMSQAVPFENPEHVQLVGDGTYLFALTTHEQGATTVIQLELAQVNAPNVVDAPNPFSVPDVIVLDRAPRNTISPFVPYRATDQLRIASDGTAIAYLGLNNKTIYIYDLLTGQTHEVAAFEEPKIALAARWSPDGAYLILLHDGTAIDVVPRAPDGETIRVTLPHPADFTALHWSADAHRLLIGPSTDRAEALLLVDPYTGTVNPLPGDPIGHAVRWDCGRAAILYSDTQYHLQRLNLETGATTSPHNLPLLNNIRVDDYYSYTPDCNWIIVNRRRDGALMPRTLYAVSADFSEAFLLHESATYRGVPPDGTALELWAWDDPDHYRLMRYDLADQSLTALTPAHDIAMWRGTPPGKMYVLLREPDNIIYRFDLQTGHTVKLVPDDFTAPAQISYAE